MSELAELLTELRKIRETLAPKSSRTIFLTNGSTASSGSLAPALTSNYQDLVKWLPREPGGILKQILLMGGLTRAFQIVINDETAASDLIFGAGSGVAFDALLDFKNKRINPQTKSGVLIQAKALGVGATTPQVFVHGEQVIEW